MSWKLRLFKSTMLPGFRMKLASLLKSHPEKTRSEIETYRNLINNAMKMSGAHADDGFSKVEGFEGEVFAQPNKTDKAIFFVHGGGFAIASPQYYRPYTKLLGEYSKFNVYAPNYGLSPENVYPHALEGVEKSYMWLTEKFDPKQIAVVGDSAGGTLVAALLLKLHQNNLKELKPASCVLSSPFVSMTHEASKEAAKYGENDPILPMEHNGIDIVASLYLTGKHIYSKEGGYLDESQLDPKELQKFNELRENPLVSPLLCEDSILKEAFPTKTLIQCGDEEALKPQIVEFSKKINAELQIYESMFHSFQICGDFFSESDEALKDMSQFINSSVSS